MSPMGERAAQGRAGGFLWDVSALLEVSRRVGAAPAAGRVDAVALGAAMAETAWNRTYAARREGSRSSEGPEEGDAAVAGAWALLDSFDQAPPGEWWSRSAELLRPQRIVRDVPERDWLAVPLHAGGPALTCGGLGRAEAVGLAIAEDGPLWGEYVVQALEPPPGDLRVLEVRTLQDWADLVETWPSVATAETTGILGAHIGLDGRWLVPDWSAVSETWDVVHLGIGAWVRTAGAVASVDGGTAWTMCAGWDPDAAFWLNGQPTVVEERTLPTMTPEDALGGR